MGNGGIASAAMEKAAAAGTVAAGGFLSVQAVTTGLNIVTAALGVTAAALAVWWWWLKIERERIEIAKLQQREATTNGTDTE